MRIRQLKNMKPVDLLETLLVLRKNAIVSDYGLKCKFGGYPEGTLVQMMPPICAGENSLLYVPGQPIRPVEVSLNAEIEKMFLAGDTPKKYIFTVKGIPILGSLIENSLAA